MTDTSIGQRYGVCWFLLVGLLFIAIMGCSEVKEQATADDTGTGSINLQLTWKTGGVRTIALTPPSGDVCVDFLVQTVEVRVINIGGSEIARQQWPCSQHGGSMVNIPAAVGYAVEVTGLIGGETRWQGSSGNTVTVVAGQDSAPVIVEMEYIGDDITPPTATTTPSDQASGLPTDSTISIVFSEAVVEASVMNNNAITVTDGISNVNGTISYDSDTYTATFQPQQELNVNGTYTITVTTDVMDVAGLHMAQDVTSSFSTTKVWFVDGSASMGSGQNWNDPFNTIPDAVAAAGPGDQLWVKTGNYILSGQVVINKSVELMGGFAGTETQEHQRDWQNLATVIDGNANSRCFFLSSNARVDGFTITRGAVTNAPQPYYTRGGGMYIDASAPAIVNCTFSDNAAGPSDGYGGAIYIASGNPLIENCSFTENNAYSGTEGYAGAIYNDQGGPIISNCTFQQNRSSGGFGNYGGAIYNNAALSTTTISNCLFDNNSASGEGGSGGAVYNHESDVAIIGCIFQNNRASGLSGYGGAVCNNGSSPTIQNCIFYKNSAGGQSTGRGGGVFNKTASGPTIINCTFVSNEVYGTDAKGGGIANLADNDNDASNPIVTNTILWDNQAQSGRQLHDGDYSTTTITYSDIDQIGFSTGNNLRKRPRFGTGFHLRADSPCIDQGDNDSAPSLDIDGEARPQSSAVDVGADEFRDSDGDRMPDYWEVLNGFNLSADDAETDDDGDLLSALAEYHLGTDPKSAEKVVSAVDRGAWSSVGDHTATNQSTPTGLMNSDSYGYPPDTYRSFFIFNLGTSVSTVTGAAVRLELAAFASGAAEETIQIFEVSTDTDTLAAGGSGQSAIYTDLGSGVFFGDFDTNPADQSNILDISLNQDAVDSINAAGSGNFAIGLKLETIGVGEISFSIAEENRVHQLILIEQ